MKRALTTAVIAVSQLALVGLAVAPQLSARVAGDPYLVRVAPVDPIDPFRGAYVALDYPDLRDDESRSFGEPGLGGGRVNGPTRRWRLDLAYDGADFSGWARQPGLRRRALVEARVLARSMRNHPALAYLYLR